MVHLPLTEEHCREHLFPFTLTRHTADIRVGILTIREKWERFAWPEHLSRPEQGIPANLVPGNRFFQTLRTNGWEAALARTEQYRVLQHPWDIISANDWALREDFDLITSGRTSAAIPGTVQVTGQYPVFAEEDVRLTFAYINTSSGPVYLGRGTEVMEGAMLRGPVSIGEGSLVKMGAAIYGATSIGPHCIAGGEIKNAIFFEYSNKAHDGYIGDSVLGAWCNIGAGSSCSNIRNTATPVAVWDMQKKTYVQAGLKCGLLMGDYSRCSINSSFNTGTVVGVCANIFQPGALLPKYIPSFSWGAGGQEKYRLEKAIADIGNWMKLKQAVISQDQVKQLSIIHSNIENL